MIDFYYKLSNLRWSQHSLAPALQELWRTENSPSENNLALNHTVKAYRHDPDWKDYGEVKIKSVDDYISEILGQLPHISWINSISILFSTESIPLHRERHDKTASLVIPLTGEPLNWTTFFQSDTGELLAEVKIDCPTLIRTDIAHGVRLSGKENLRTMLCFRSRRPTTFEDVIAKLT